MELTTRAALPLMLLAMALIPVGDTAGKLLTDGQGVSPIFVAWSRFAIGACVVAPFALGAFQLRLLTDWRIWLRALILVGGITSILTALQTESIANVFGAFFIGPILSWLLSVWLLREPFSAFRLGLVCLGFVGVLLVVKPGFGMTTGTGFAILAGVFYGVYLVMSRWMADVAQPRALLMSQLLVGALVLTLPGSVVVPTFDLEVGALVLTSALCSAAGNFLLIVAYAKAEASKLAPFVYTQLIWATALGVVVFGIWPDTFALLGLSFLLISGGAALFKGR